jgi:hypothetical protein
MMDKPQSQPPESERIAGSTPDQDTPAAVLGDLWNALDVLPAARSTPNLASSTMEMAAVSVARGVPSSRPVDAKRGLSERWRWMVAGVIVSASLAAGFVTGSAGNGAGNNRRSPRAPELAVVITHLETLEEAGSIAFLEAFAQGDYVVPTFSGRDGAWRGRAGGQPRPPENSAEGADAPATDESADGVDERLYVPTPELDAAIEDFRRVFLAGEWVLPPPSVQEEEADNSARDMIAAMDAAQQFEFNRIAYGELAPSQREAYLALAQALADPNRSDLVDAARLWHAWVEFADPVERAGLVQLPASERMEWLDRRMRQWRRFMPGRGGEDERPEGSSGGRGGAGRGPADGQRLDAEAKAPAA